MTVEESGLEVNTRQRRIKYKSNFVLESRIESDATLVSTVGS